MSRHFLIIDDDPIFQAVAEEVIAQMGDHTVSLAEDGEVGLALLHEHGARIDTVILDINMPKLDGLGFLREASKTAFRGDVVISSGELDAVIGAARNLGEMLGVRISGALKKPLTPEQLHTTLRLQGDTARSANDRLSRKIGLEDSSILPYYQPKFDLRDGAMLGFEALLRVETLDGTIHGPGFLFDRLDTADDLFNATIRIGEVVTADMRRWLDVGLSPAVAINIDVSTLEEPRTVEWLKGLVASRGIAAGSVTLELTETSLPNDLSRIVESLARLRMAGFELSLDDYGTGGSNFELLRLCPFTEIKIDQSIIRTAGVEPLSMRFIEFCMHAAADRGIRIVAEGIETKEQMDLVRAAGITIGQGFLMARPQPADVTERLLRLSKTVQ